MAEERTTTSKSRNGNGALSPEQRQSVVQALGRMPSEQVQARIPTADLDERDPDYIRETLPGLWLLGSFYFRADVQGLDKIPAAGAGPRVEGGSWGDRGGATSRPTRSCCRSPSPPGSASSGEADGSPTDWCSR